MIRFVGGFVGAASSFWFKNILFWDIVPDASWRLDYGKEADKAFGQTYSMRLVIWQLIQKSAIVTEVLDITGKACSQPLLFINIVDNALSLLLNALAC